MIQINLHSIPLDSFSVLSVLVFSAVCVEELTSRSVSPISPCLLASDWIHSVGLISRSAQGKRKQKSQHFFPYSLPESSPQLWQAVAKSLHDCCSCWPTTAQHSLSSRNTASFPCPFNIIPLFTRLGSLNPEHSSINCFSIKIISLEKI